MKCLFENGGSLSLLVSISGYTSSEIVSDLSNEFPDQQSIETIYKNYVFKQNDKYLLIYWLPNIYLISSSGTFKKLSEY